MPTIRPETTHIPVSIADLPSHEFSVTPDTVTEKVVEELENRPGVPGVMIAENGRLFGLITRLKLFERLGHRFGVELFLQKPIIQLKDLIRTNAQVLPGHMRIDEVVEYALGRHALDIYDPLVVLHDDGIMRLLDINVLLLAQSRAMASLSNVVGNLQQVDRMIQAEFEQGKVFAKILQLLRQVVPYHQAAILLVDQAGLGFAAFAGYRYVPKRADAILKSELYALIMRHGQAIYLPKACQVPAWQNMEALGMPLAWLGVPLLTDNRSLGLLSISRDIERTFSTEERDTVLAFVQRIVELLRREQRADNQLAGLRAQKETRSGSNMNNWEVTPMYVPTFNMQ